MKLFPTHESPNGSYIELSKALRMGYSTLREVIKEGKDSMEIGNLIKLLDVLKMPYEVVTPYIKSIGSGEEGRGAIKNPKLPFDMYNPDGARILAAALKDGHIEKDRHHFRYTNNNLENRRIVAEAIKSVFGDIEPGPIYDRGGRQNGIFFNSAIIGDVLLRVGAVEGRKTSREHHLPEMIRFGGLEIRRAYFEQVIRDEGSRTRRPYRIRICGTHDIESLMTEEHWAVVELLPRKKKNLPSGRLVEILNLRKGLEDNLPDDMKPIFRDFMFKMQFGWVPSIFKEEKEALENTYGVEAKIEPKKIYKGEKLGMRGVWDITIEGKENSGKMLRQLGSVWKGGEGKEWT